MNHISELQDSLFFRLSTIFTTVLSFLKSKAHFIVYLPFGQSWVRKHFWNSAIINIWGVRFLLTGSKRKVVVIKIADSYYILHVTLTLRRSSTDALTWTKITGNINSSSSVIMFYTVDYRKYEFLNDQTVYCRGFDRVSIPTHCQIGKCRKFTKQPTFIQILRLNACTAFWLSSELYDLHEVQNWYHLTQLAFHEIVRD